MLFFIVIPEFFYSLSLAYGKCSYAIDKLVKTPEIINKFSNILTQLRGGDVKAALQDLFGDLNELKEIIKGAIEYSQDVNKKVSGALFGDYSEFGGLAGVT